jgi:pimeloyl-ACP methyl ester carboxylesterase
MAIAFWRGRRIMEWLLVVAAFVIGVPAAAWLAQDRLIFFPQPISGAAPLPPQTRSLDLVAGDGTRLAGFFVPAPTSPAPALIYFGGNAEEISWTLADRRWPLLWSRAALNYRGYGASEGKPGERELVADAVSLFDAIAARDDVDPRRVVVVGRSLGSGVAVQLAAVRPVAATVLISPFDSLVAVGRMHYPWLPVDWLLRHRFDARAAAGRIATPLLAIVGSDDRIIPPARSRALYDAWAGPKRWVEVSGADHNDLGSGPAMWDAIGRFVDDLPAIR